jgi:hypothetical protein
VRQEATLGRQLPCRLVKFGACDIFTVPEDFNLMLLDELKVESRSTGLPDDKGEERKILRPTEVACHDVEARGI